MKYEAIIIGGGPAGLTAGLYLSRARIKTALIESALCGGQMWYSELVENYPGIPEGIEGNKLSDLFKQQAVKFGLKIIEDEVVRVVPGACVETAGGKKYEAIGIIIATGAGQKKLGVPGEKELTGRGVSYCATCDGPLFRDKEVVVVGGGDTAVQEAVFLTKFCKKVYLVHRRDRLRATKIIQERALSLKDKLEPVWNGTVKEIKGSSRVETVVIEDVKKKTKSEIRCDGVFIFAGVLPNTGFLNGVVDTDKQGYIITDEDMKTSVDGIYACGDARGKLLRQIVTACGEGATAAFACQHYIEAQKGEAYV